MLECLAHDYGVTNISYSTEGGLISCSKESTDIRLWNKETLDLYGIINTSKEQIDRFWVFPSNLV